MVVEDEDEGEEKIGGESGEEKASEIHICVRVVWCVAHTFQLAMYDVTDKNTSEAINEIVAKKQVPNSSEQFKYEKARSWCFDTLDNSSYFMVQYLKQNDFVMNGLAGVDSKHLEDEFWNDIKLFVVLFKPPYIFSKKLQQQNLTVGDFYLGWLECDIMLKN